MKLYVILRRIVMVEVLLGLVWGYVLIRRGNAYNPAVVVHATATPEKLATSQNAATPERAATPTGKAVLAETATPVPTHPATSVLATVTVSKTVLPTEAPASQVTATASSPVSQGALCAAQAVDLFLAPASTKAPAGKLEATAKVSVLSRQDGWAKIQLEGWSMEGAPSIVYALEGVRIRKAILAEAAQKNIKRLKTVTDPNTDQVWHLVRLSDVWVLDNKLTPDLTTSWGDASKWFHKACAGCHALPKPNKFTANQWPGILKMMGPRTSLSDDQVALIKKYLQYNAKDTAKMTDVIPCYKQSK